MNKKHTGSNLDDFLREEQLLHPVETTALKRLIAFSKALGILLTTSFYDMVYIYATGRSSGIWYEPKFIWIRLLKRN